MYNITMIHKSKIRTIRTAKNKKIKKQLGGQGNNVPPSLKDNLKKFADIWLQVFNNVSMYTLDKIEDKVTNASISLGINPNNSIKSEIEKIGQKAKQLNYALDTPQGKRALSNLKELFDRITKRVIVPNSEKLTEELIENLQPILIRGQNAVFALLSASPFGAIIDIPRFFSESLGVIEKSVTLADGVLDIGQDTVKKVNLEKGNFDNIVSEISSLAEKTNAQISSGLNSVKNTVDTYGKGIMAPEIPSEFTPKIPSEFTPKIPSEFRPKIPSEFTPKIPSEIADVNSSLQKYQNQSRMIGGRVKNSYLDFVSTNVTSPQIIKQYGGTRKRRILQRNKLHSRRYK